MRKAVVVLSVAIGSLAFAPSAGAVIPSVFGGDVQCSVAMDGVRECGRNGQNEVQTVDIDATGGDYTLEYDGQTTGQIAFDATAAAVQSALEGLSNVEPNDVSVAKTSATHYNITFLGRLARTNVPQILGDGSGLTGGATTVTTATTTQGETASQTNETFDGVPVDINVAFPAGPSDGPFPLIVWGHGYGGAKFGFGAMRRFTSRGYAVMSMTTRGFRESCGSENSRITDGSTICEDEGYVRLMDTRYEVRDYQDLAGLLAEDGRTSFTQIGAVGGSYGGGLSMALAALKNRQMVGDPGTLVPWQSPNANTPMSLAAATPNIPWTDLAYSLVPNGRTLDYTVDNDYGSRVGVMKQSLTNGLYISGNGAPGYYSGELGPPVDPDADLTGWLARLTAGEPYGADAQAIVSEIAAHHSSFYINQSVAPAPMLMSSGFTDDLFPADETIRFYHRVKVQHPGTPTSLFFGDFGHQRSGNKADVSNALVARENQWLDFFVKGTGSAPSQDVTAYTQTCPSTSGTPSGGPFSASNWATIAPGELRLTDTAAKTLAPTGGSDAVGQTFDPVFSTLGANPPRACATTAANDEPGIANYSLPAMTEPTTLMGSTTVIADISSGSANNGMAARLLDVLPDGTERLVARGLWRPEPGTSRQVFQLHANGYAFNQGSVPRLQLLPKDSSASTLTSYGRKPNGQTAITVGNVEVRLPVTSRPGASGGAVKVPRDEYVPAGRSLSPDFAALNNDANATIADGKLTAGKKFVDVKLGSPANWVACHATVEVYFGTEGLASAAAKGKKGKKGKKKKKKKKKGNPTAQLLGTGTGTVPGGETGTVRIELNAAGRKLAKKNSQKRLVIRVATAEQDGLVQEQRTAVFKKKGKKKKKGKGKKGKKGKRK